MEEREREKTLVSCSHCTIMLEFFPSLSLPLFPLPSSLPSPFLPSPLLDSVVSATLGVSVLFGVREAGVYDRASVWGGGGVRLVSNAMKHGSGGHSPGSGGRSPG